MDRRGGEGGDRRSRLALVGDALAEFLGQDTEMVPRPVQDVQNLDAVGDRPVEDDGGLEAGAWEVAKVAELVGSIKRSHAGHAD